MNKIILVFCAVLAVATGLPVDGGDRTVTEFYEAADEEEYVPSVGEQVKLFKSLYAQRTDLIHYVNSTDIYLNQSKENCLDKYRALMPTINNVTQSMNACIEPAKNAIRTFATHTLFLTMAQSYEAFQNNTKECREKFVFREENDESFIFCLIEKVQEHDTNLRLSEKPLQALLQKKVKQIEESLTKAVDCAKGVKKETESKVTKIGKYIEICNDSYKEEML